MFYDIAKPRFGLGPNHDHMEVTILKPGKTAAECIVERLVVIKRERNPDGTTTISALEGNPNDGPQGEVIIDLDESGRGTMYSVSS